MRKNAGLIGILVLFILVALIIAAVVAYFVYFEVNTYEISGTVEDKQIVPSGNRDDPMSYVIWLTNGRKLEVKANLFHNNNEDDLWRLIKVNGTYTFTCWGYQCDIPALGIYWYPNVVGVEEIS